MLSCRSHPPMQTVDYVEMSQMEGTWYVTHHIPYWLERGKVATADVYTFRDDGRIDVRYDFRREHFGAEEESWNGISWVYNKETNAHWKVRFIWPFTIDYLIIQKDLDYQWVAVGHPSRKYFWILSRTRQLSQDIVDRIFEEATLQGYDPEKFAPVPQPTKAQEG